MKHTSPLHTEIVWRVAWSTHLHPNHWNSFHHTAEFLEVSPLVSQLFWVEKFCKEYWRVVRWVPRQLAGMLLTGSGTEFPLTGRQWVVKAGGEVTFSSKPSRDLAGSLHTQIWPCVLCRGSLTSSIPVTVRHHTPGQIPSSNPYSFFFPISSTGCLTLPLLLSIEILLFFLLLFLSQYT